jgi:hypothetical protein
MLNSIKIFKIPLIILGKKILLGFRFLLEFNGSYKNIYA